MDTNVTRVDWNEIEIFIQFQNLMNKIMGQVLENLKSVKWKKRDIERT